MKNKCYICNGDHRLVECPIKDMFGRKLMIGNQAERTVDKTKTDANATVLITNLSKNTNEIDIEDLAKPFGHIRKVYLDKDKVTGLCKGFALVHFKKHSDAATAIAALNGCEFGVDNIILNACWAKNQGQ